MFAGVRGAELGVDSSACADADPADQWFTLATGLVAPLDRVSGATAPDGRMLVACVSEFDVSDDAGAASVESGSTSRTTGRDGASVIGLDNR